MLADSRWRLTVMRRRSLAKLLTVQLIATVASAMFLAQYGYRGGHLYTQSVLSGVPAALMVTLVERVLFPRIYKLPFLPSVILRTVLLGSAVVVGFALGLWTIYAVASHLPITDISALSFVQSQMTNGRNLPTAAFVFVALLIYSAFAQLTKWLGPGVLGSLLTGRYFHPRREERIFMFLDMKNSTTLAEQLGDLKFSSLVRDFFYDMTPAILESEASVLLFVGDEVILTWPMERGIRNNRFLRAYYGAKQNIARRAHRYQERYGIVPDFKAGIHGGSVVGTQVGDVKTELVYHGDVLNTSARIRSLCTDLDIDLLISEELHGRLTGLEWVQVGTHPVKGRQRPVTVYTLPNEMAENRPAIAERAHIALPS